MYFPTPRTILKPVRDTNIKREFDTEALGADRIKSAAKRWRRAYKTDGVIVLTDTRINNTGRPSTKELSLEEKYAQLEAKMNLLKTENELLKKLDMIERKDKIKVTCSRQKWLRNT